MFFCLLFAATLFIFAIAIPHSGGDYFFQELANVRSLQHIVIRYLNEIMAARDDRPRLTDIMDRPLLAQTFGIVDYVRGYTETPEADQRTEVTALRFLRIAVVWHCASYAQQRFASLTVLFRPGDERVDAAQSAAAERFERIADGIAWIVDEFPAINREADLMRTAMARFYQFPIGVSFQNGLSHVLLFLRNDNPIRFRDNGEKSSIPSSIKLNFLTNLVASPCGNHMHCALVINNFALFSRPIPMQPLNNYANDLNLLFLAHNSVLLWTAQPANQRWTLDQQLIQPELRALIDAVLKEAILETNYVRQIDDALRFLAQFALLTHYVEFLDIMYFDQQCVRARVLERLLSSTSARFNAHVAYIDAQHAQLHYNYARLNDVARCMLGAGCAVVREAYARLMNVGFRVTYTLNRPDVVLRVDCSTHRNLPIQDHFDYEAAPASTTTTLATRRRS